MRYVSRVAVFDLKSPNFAFHAFCLIAFIRLCLLESHLDARQVTCQNIQVNVARVSVLLHERGAHLSRAAFDAILSAADRGRVDDHALLHQWHAAAHASRFGRPIAHITLSGVAGTFQTRQP